MSHFCVAVFSDSPDDLCFDGILAPYNEEAFLVFHPISEEELKEEYIKFKQNNPNHSYENFLDCYGYVEEDGQWGCYYNPNAKYDYYSLDARYPYELKEKDYAFKPIFNWTNTVASVFIISVNTGAYMSEIVRSGIQSVDGGQTEAARSLGMSNIQTMMLVVLPQAIKNAFPSIGNEFIVNIKDSSVLSIISISSYLINTKLYSSEKSAI